MEEEHVIIDCDVPPHLVEDLGSSESTGEGRKRYNCDICGYASNQAGNYKTHKLIHTGEKPFKCNVCNYACNRLGYLKTHKLIHSGEKPYKCNICSYACIDSSTLGKHKRVHSGEKPYGEGRKRHKCDICSYACNKKGNLRRHIQLVHTTESTKQQINDKKLYKCTHCDYVCPHKGNLRRHTELIHIRESTLRRNREGKPYKYNISDFAAHQFKHMKMHKLIHNGEELNKCNVSDCAGYEVCNLRTHTKQIHGGRCVATSTQTVQFKKQQSSLEENLSSQSLETEHSCRDCSYYSNSLSGLQNHLLLHSEVQNVPHQNKFL